MRGVRFEVRPSEVVERLYHAYNFDASRRPDLEGLLKSARRVSGWYVGRLALDCPSADQLASHLERRARCVPGAFGEAAASLARLLRALEREFSEHWAQAAGALEREAERLSSLADWGAVASAISEEVGRELAETLLPFARVGSLRGLELLERGWAQLAGCHLLHPSGQYNLPFMGPRLRAQATAVVSLAWRTQGLMVAPGNPLGIASLSDLRRPEVRLVNRNPGSGTRLLLDQELARLGINPREVQGYDHEVGSHLEVALAVRRGEADVGLGIQAVAELVGLEFIPLRSERYDLVFGQVSDRFREALIETMRSERFRSRAALGGYDLDACGQVLVHP